MTLAALVALAALLVAGFSLVRASRLPAAPAEVPEDRTFESLREGDVVVVPDGDFIVESRRELSDGPARSALFALRSGRVRRFLLVPPDGAIGFAQEAPSSPHVDRTPGARKLDRANVELLPGA